MRVEIRAFLRSVGAGMILPEVLWILAFTLPNPIRRIGAGLARQIRRMRVYGRVAGRSLRRPWDTRPNVPMRVEIRDFLRSVRAGMILPKALPPERTNPRRNLISS